MSDAVQTVFHNFIRLGYNDACLFAQMRSSVFLGHTKFLISDTDLLADSGWIKYLGGQLAYYKFHSILQVSPPYPSFVCLAVRFCKHWHSFHPFCLICNTVIFPLLSFSMLRQMNRHKIYWHRLQNWHLFAIAITTLVLAPVVLFVVRSPKSDSYLSSPSLGEKWNSIRPLVQFSPTFEYVNRSEVIWQIPESAKGVLFIAHGCNGKAINFWDRSPNCANCVGLPEERLLVLHALARKYAVITISSKNACWSIFKEKEKVKRILKWWVQKKRLEEVPMMALGASSGGYFVSALAAEFQFASITIMISEGVFGRKEVQTNYPPTLFVHMPKDKKRMGLIIKNMEMLKRKGIDVGEVRCPEFPLTATFLSDRIPGLDEKVSRRIYGVFRESNIINETNYMIMDGRAINWREPLKEKHVFSDAKSEWEGHIQEELNLAYGYHEMTSLQSKQIFQWFDSHLSRHHQTS